jgi:hypothetical protein
MDYKDFLIKNDPSWSRQIEVSHHQAAILSGLKQK